MREEQAIHNLDQKEDPAVYFLTELQWTLHAVDSPAEENWSHNSAASE